MVITWALMIIIRMVITVLIMIMIIITLMKTSNYNPPKYSSYEIASTANTNPSTTQYSVKQILKSL